MGKAVSTEVTTRGRFDLIWTLGKTFAEAKISYLRKRCDISNGTTLVLHTNSLLCLAFLLLRTSGCASTNGLDSTCSNSVEERGQKQVLIK